MAEAEQIGWGYASNQFGPQLWVKYRLTLEIYKKLWGVQEGKCAGCKSELAHPLIKAVKTGVKPHVDHDHAITGAAFERGLAVRGLLCRKCNEFLGKIQDNKELLEALQTYLKTPPRSLI